MNATLPTAAEYRELAKGCSQRSAESWERSDTDGFLSQWASDQMASTYLHNAQIVEQGGLTVYVLVSIKTGRVIATMDDQKEGGPRIGGGSYRQYFYITDAQDAAEVGTRYLTESNARNPEVAVRNNAKKGFRIEERFIPLSGLFESSRTGRIEVSDWSALKG